MIAVAVFAGVCLFLLAPFALFAVVLGRRDWRSVALAAVLFLAGGVVGWLRRPPEWRYPLRQTIVMSMDAATYGHPLEHRAEQVLMWFVAGAFFGGVASLPASWIARRFQRA
jgi:hypothetical protein